MSGSVEVIVPFRGGCPHRNRAWEWCRERYEWPVVEAGFRSADGSGNEGTEHKGTGQAPWIKALAVMPAVEQSRAEIIVLADADVHCDGIPWAVQQVQQGAFWATPHRDVWRLSEEGSRAYMAGEPVVGLPLDQRPYDATEGGGIVVIRRELLLEVPLDPRFVGWGQEDHSWGMALYTMLGPAIRGNARLVHLWHPHPQRLNRKRGSVANWELFRRYCKARVNQDTMKALLEEARAAYEVHQQTMRDLEAVGSGG